MSEEYHGPVCIHVPWDHADDEIKLIIAINYLIEQAKSSLMINLDDEAILRVINYISNRYN